MKEVIVASHIGLCFGVERALSIVDRTKDDTVYVLGSLIHNPQIIEKIKEKGVLFIKRAEEAKKGTVIISAHGASLAEKAILKKRGIRMIDATCPLVDNIHETTLDLEKKGYKILILGDGEHAEVKALSDNLRNVVVVTNEDSVPDMGGSKLAVVSQTTQNIDGFNRYVKRLQKEYPETKIFNTICNATRIRQESARDTANRVDLMIVIGGYNSANTRRLWEICSDIVETKHVETARELQREWFLKRKRIGITAGASTPSWLIDEVVEKVRNY